MVRQIRERGYTVQICNLTLMYPIFVMTIKFSLDSTWEVFHRDFGGFDQRWFQFPPANKVSPSDFRVFAHQGIHRRLTFRWDNIPFLSTFIYDIHRLWSQLYSMFGYVHLYLRWLKWFDARNQFISLPPFSRLPSLYSQCSLHPLYSLRNCLPSRILQYPSTYVISTIHPSYNPIFGHFISPTSPCFTVQLPLELSITPAFRLLRVHCRAHLGLTLLSLLH